MPPSVLELVRLPFRPLVVQGDQDAGIEKRELAQPLRQRVEAELDRLEDLGVREERDLRAAPLRLARDLEVARRLAALVRLLVDELVAPDLEVQRFGERVDHRHADAVEAAGHLVAVVVELPARVQHRQDDLGGRAPALVQVHGDAAAVVHDGDGVVDVDRDVDGVAEPGERLVDRVVDDFVDEVVKAGRAGGPDVHRGPLAHRLEALEHLDLVGAVVVDRRLTVGRVAVGGNRRGRRVDRDL